MAGGVDSPGGVVWVLVGLTTLTGWAVPTSLAPVWVSAMQAYIRQDYPAAHAGFARLLQGDLTPSEREELLWQDIVCLQHLGQAAAAAASLDTLRQVAPTSPYVQVGRPWLYAYDLTAGHLQHAETLWQEAVTARTAAPELWSMVKSYLHYAVTTAPERIAESADLLTVLPFDAVRLRDDVYQPLLLAKRSREASALQERLQAYWSTRDPARADQCRQAYTDAMTRDVIDRLLASFTTALQAGDLDGARITLEQINMLIPEYPQAVEARKQYRAAVAAHPQE